MSKNAPQEAEAQVVGKATQSTDDTARDARQSLSDAAMNEMKNMSQAAKSATGDSGVNSLDKNSAGNAAEIGGEAIKHIDGISKGNIGEKLQELTKEGSIAIGIGISKRADVTPEDRAEAKEKLGKELSDLIPEADKKTITDLQNALIDGDTKKFGEALKALSGDPAKLEKFVKALNDNLNKNEMFGGVEVSMDGKGNVLVYGEKGNTAVSFDPKTGESSLRAVERQDDGSVLLKPGEVINRKPDEVMKNLGDEATRSLQEPIFKPHPWKPGFPNKPMPMPEFPPNKPWSPKDPFDGGNSGGGKWDFPKDIKPLMNELSDKSH
ncbi:hypothetical protein KF707_00140 [Candidatus Obscuribacterales bacterium]|nr:hypothetical protein [Candidatus Obscuribacterales bacterium]